MRYLKFKRVGGVFGRPVDRIVLMKLDVFRDPNGSEEQNVDVLEN